MRPDYSGNPREQMEAQLTALLLGELSAGEAASVRAAMEEDPSLAQLHAQLEHTIGLVREAAANPGPELVAPAAPLKLSAERRERLQAAFKTCAVPASSRELNWMVPMSIAAVLVALIGSVVLLPAFWERPRLSARLASRPSLIRATDSAFKAKNQVGKPISGEQFGRSAPGSAPVGSLPQSAANRSENKAGDARGLLLPEQLQSSDKAAVIERARNYRFAGTASEKDSAANGLAGGFGGSGSRSAAQENTWLWSTRPEGGGIGGGGGGGLAGSPAVTLEFSGVAEPEGGKLGVAAKPPDVAALGAQVPGYRDDNSVLPGPQTAASPRAALGDYDNDGSLNSIVTASPSAAALGLTVPDKVLQFSVADQESAQRQLGERGATDFFAKVGQAGRIAGVPAGHGEPVTGQPTPSPVLGDKPSFGMIFSPDGKRLAQGGSPPSGMFPGQAPYQIPELDQKVSEKSATFDRLSETPSSSALSIDGSQRLKTRGEALPQVAQKTESEGETFAYRNANGLFPHSNADEEARKTEMAKDQSAAKNDLKTQESLLDTLKLRIAEERTDVAQSKQSSAQIVDLARAEADRGSTMLAKAREMVTGKAARTARVEVERDSADRAPLLFGARQQNTFDPYFVQTEFEKVKSKQVLDKVIEKLDLNQAWAQRYGGGQKLSNEQAYQRLVQNVEVRQPGNTNVIDIRVSSENAEEAAKIANTIAEVYRDVREAATVRQQQNAQEILAEREKTQEQKVASAREQLQSLERQSQAQQADVKAPRPAASAPAFVPQPEIQTSDNAFSTFSLNVSDVSFKLAAASLEQGHLPEPGTIRSEEFINAFDYRDPEPVPGMPVAFAWERARYPFAHDRDLLRFSIKTAAAGRQAGAPLNVVLLLDRSGSMERADRVQIVQEALRVLAGQLQAQDRLSVITFARTARLWADGLAGNEAGPVLDQVSRTTPEGGTNLEEAMKLAYQTALKHYVGHGGNRVVLFTDGAANLGNVDPEALKLKVEASRKQGIALDCYGIGWEGYDDDLLETLSRNGDGRYRFLNTPEEAATGFAEQLAGAFHVAASDVKVQVEFNPKRVSVYRQIGYAKHQLTKEQFRDNTVDAAEIGAAESGTALYSVQVDPRGDGPLAVVRVRYKTPGTGEVHEQEWSVPYTGQVLSLEQASVSLRLAGTAAAFAEWLASSPYATEVTPDRLSECLKGVSQSYGVDVRPRKLEAMIQQAKSLAH